jgi:hypothetical protein
LSDGGERLLSRLEARGKRLEERGKRKEERN